MCVFRPTIAQLHRIKDLYLNPSLLPHGLSRFPEKDHIQIKLSEDCLQGLGFSFMPHTILLLLLYYLFPQFLGIEMNHPGNGLVSHTHTHTHTHTQNKQPLKFCYIWLLYFFSILYLFFPIVPLSPCLWSNI
jgi:hypothetical protein